MGYPSFDLKEFVEQIHLPGEARIVEVNETDTPQLVYAVVAQDFPVLLRPEMKSAVATIEMHIVVAWSSQHDTLEFSAPIKINTNLIKDLDKRFAVLVDAANSINYEESGDTGKIILFRDEHGESIAVLDFSVVIPKEFLQKAESMAALLIILGANLARLFEGSLRVSKLLDEAQKAVLVQKKSPRSQMLH